MELLEKCVPPTRTSGALQLEFEIGDTAVGARKVILVLSCVFYSTRDTDTPHMICCEGVLHATQASEHTHKLLGLRICQ